MAKPQVLSVEESAAAGARLSQVEVVANHPMPFSSKITEELRKIHPACAFIDCSSLSSAINSAIGASLGGKRVFVPTSIPKSVEDIYTLSYMRLPVVIANVSRPLGAFSIKHDHSDISALLDSGCLVFMPESNQELIDTIVQAYKVSEEVMLPSIVNIDISGYRETVQPVPDIFARRFVGKLRAQNFEKKPKYFAVPDDNYAEYKKQQHKAVKLSAEAIEKASKVWQKKFQRSLPLAESYRLEDADFAIVISGYHSTTAKAAVDELRNNGKKVGLLRIRVLRPFPSDLIANALKNVKRFAVFDQSASPGRFGTLYRELNDKSRCTNVISLGAHPDEKTFADIFERLEKSGKDEVVWA